MRRLFVGWVATGPSRAALAAAREALRTRLPQRGIRWVADADLHLTLRFLGQTAPESAARVADALPRIAAGRRRLRVQAGAPCAWPSAAGPRVLVVEVESGGALEALATELDVALRACGVATEPRRFRAHITLARVDAGAPADGDLSGLPAAGEIELDRLALVDSAPRADGTRYREVAGFALGGG